MRQGSNNLSYPIADRPQPAELVPVVPGVFWIRMPLPISLNHINLWLLEDGDGWMIVDTGMATDESREIWRALFEKHLDGKPVTRVLGTHMHLDHIGLAGWLTDRWQAELWMSRTEYLTCRVVAAEISADPPPDTIEFFRTAGFDSDALSDFEDRFRARSAFVSTLPSAFRRIVDGQTIQIGQNSWCVMVGEGHSPEHACLYCSDLNVLIAGDQILPRISPNVGVRPNEPAANPLRDWLTSCEKFQSALPEDTLILPSHGDPFYGAHARLQAIVDEHRESLKKLYDFCVQPQRAIDVFPLLFKGEITDHNRVIAAGEALAHLNYLLAEGKLSVESDATGVNRYRQA